MPHDATLKTFPFKGPDGLSYSLVIAESLADDYTTAVRATGALSDVARFFLSVSKPGDVFLDIGANIGTVAVPMAAKGCAVHAFEIFPANIASLRGAQKLYPNIHVAPFAAWSADGYVSISGASAYTIVSGTGGETRSVRVDTYANNNSVDRIDFVKIDIEGAELECLRGMTDTLRHKNPTIIIESNILSCGRAGYSYRMILDHLQSFGYAIFRMRGTTLYPFDHRADFQECICCDYLATAANLFGMTEGTPFSVKVPSSDEIVASLLSNATASDVHKLYALNACIAAPRRIRENPAIERSIAEWVAAVQSLDPGWKSTLEIGSGPTPGGRVLR
jgi:FkbM family methyltransferase